MVTIFVNPYHGNEPYILGALVADALAKLLGDVKIIMPLFYGDRQKGILAEQHLRTPILFDEKLGSLYKKILFSKGRYAEHLDDMNAHRSEVEENVRSHLEQYGIDLELTIASRITSTAPSFYIFPYIISELLERTLKHPELAVSFGTERLRMLHTAMETVDKKHSRFFVPSYHTFSFDTTRELFPNEVATPPLKPLPPPDTREIPEQSVYCIVSGADAERHSLIERARALEAEGKTVFFPQWSRVDGFKTAPPEIITNKNITKVIARAGWGTMWMCQQAGKAFEALPYTPGDDPEIFFNLETLDTTSLQQATNEQREHFTSMDGITFVAQAIARHLKR